MYCSMCLGYVLGLNKKLNYRPEAKEIILGLKWRNEMLYLIAEYCVVQSD